MTDINLDGNPKPNYPCRYECCAEEISYPSDMLAIHPHGGVVCDECWNEHAYGEGLTDSWTELPQFQPIVNLWQPIETAPKDAVILLVRYDGRVAQGKFRDDLNVWIESNGNVWGTTAPTHWMPLPTPPEEGE